MKKNYSVIFILMAFVLSISCLWKTHSTTAFASASGDGYGIDVTAKSAYMIDPNTKTVIYKKNETMRLPIASMCKVMTLLLAFEEIDGGNLCFDDEITVSENASGMGGSQVFLESNTCYKVEDLIKSIVVASANDASVAIAEHICGSEELFVEKMNERANELGMENTQFSNCTGLPRPNQFSCAKDVATMYSELTTHKDYFKFSTIWMDEISHPNDRKTGISNTNKLVRFYEGCEGGKTGYTSEAGHCLVASAKRNGLRLVSSIISAVDSKTRFKEVSSMFNYGFANYVNKMIIDDKKPLELNVEVKGGKSKSISVKAENPVFLLSLKNEKRSVDIEFLPLTEVVAPVKEGDVVGKVMVYENGVEIATVNIVSLENVDKCTYFDVVGEVIQNWALI